MNVPEKFKNLCREMLGKSTMRGARSLSPELERVIEALSPEQPDEVVVEAVASIHQDYFHDNEILGAINAIEIPIRLNPELCRRCERLSLEADTRYLDLDEAGRKAESDVQSRRMCIFNGLGRLFSANELTPHIADEMV